MTFLLSAVSFLTGGVGRYISIAVIAAIAWFSWLSGHDKKVTRKAVENINVQSDKRVQKARKARRSIRTLSDAERLLKTYCRDC